MKIDRWIAEATECDFKAALETMKPKRTYYAFPKLYFIARERA